MRHLPEGGIRKILQTQPVPVAPLGLSNQWGSYFSRVEKGGATVQPFGRALFSPVWLVAGAPIAVAAVTSAKLRERVVVVLLAA
jgi:hypothetical protein